MVLPKFIEIMIKFLFITQTTKIVIVMVIWMTRVEMKNIQPCARVSARFREAKVFLALLAAKVNVKNVKVYV